MAWWWQIITIASFSFISWSAVCRPTVHVGCLSLQCVPKYSTPCNFNDAVRYKFAFALSNVERNKQTKSNKEYRPRPYVLAKVKRLSVCHKLLEKKLSCRRESVTCLGATSKIEFETHKNEVHWYWLDTIMNVTLRFMTPNQVGIFAK